MRNSKCLAILILLSVGVLAPGVLYSQTDVDSRAPDTLPRPILMGSSCGNTPSLPFIYTGTCGGLVRSFSAPAIPLILSNNHVLGTQGPDLCPNDAVPFETQTVQAGTLDLGFDPGPSSRFTVGLVAGFVPMVTPGFNLVDAAVSFTTDALATSEIVGLGEPTQAVTTPTIGMTVTKTGRTTDTTVGRIRAINVASFVNFGPGCEVPLFVQQIEIVTGSFSAPGDSGSFVLEEATNIPVGLLFAGSSESTLANDIRLAYLLLGVFPDGVPPATGEVLSEAAIARQVAGDRDGEIGRVMAIQARAQPQLFANREVVGVGIGPAAEGDGLALIVYSRSAAGPVAAALPHSVEGIPVRVIETGEFRAF